MARRYGKVSPQLWAGSLADDLRGDHLAQTVACYLITSPHANSIGLYRLPVGYISEDIGCSREEALQVLERLEKAGFIRYDTKAQFVWVIEHARHEYQPLKKSDKQIDSVHRLVEAASRSCLHAEFVELYSARLLIEPPQEAPLEPHRSPFSSPSEAKGTKEQGNNGTKEQGNTDSPERAREPEESDPTWPQRQAAEFDQFWSAYPVKDGMLDAQRAWASTARVRPPTPGLLEHLEAMKRTDRWSEGFAPNPARYLRDQLWTTDPSTLNRPKGRGSDDRASWDPVGAALAERQPKPKLSKEELDRLVAADLAARKEDEP